MRYYYIYKNQEIYSITKESYSDFIFEDTMNHGICYNYVEKGNFAVISEEKMDDNQFKEKINIYEQGNKNKNT